MTSQRGAVDSSTALAALPVLAKARSWRARVILIKVFQGLESSVFIFLYEEDKKLSVGLFVK